MSIALRTITRLQDADDIGSFSDGQYLRWDEASGKFVGAPVDLSAYLTAAAAASTYAALAGAAFTGATSVAAPTTTANVLVLKTTDDNLTKSLLEIRASNNGVIGSLTADGKTLSLNAVLFGVVSGSIRGVSNGATTPMAVINQTNNPLSFYTNSLERLTILGGGNVGIANTNPVLPIHVKGVNNLPATNGTTQTGVARIQGNGSGVLDIGNVSGGGAWLQATNDGNLSVNYGLLLNPNGGSVAIRSTTNTLASGLYVPALSGDSFQTMAVGSSGSFNGAVALRADSYSNTAVMGVSVSGIGVRGTGAPGVRADSTSGNALYALLTDATTNTAPTIVTIGHNTSGTPAANYGAGLLFQLQSSTTQNRDAIALVAGWNTATDASRSSYLSIQAVDAGGSLTEIMRVNGQQVRVDFNTIAVSTIRAFSTTTTFYSPVTQTTAIGVYALNSSTLGGTSAVVPLLNISTTVNQSSTAGYTGILLNVTETATGSGAKRLLDLQAGSATKFAVGSDGKLLTNQSAAGSTLGSVVKKLPIYDAAGSLLGYCPLYDSIS